MTLARRFGAVDGPMVIALSGGPDSGAVAAIAADSSVAVRCLHVYHALPGSDVMRDAALEIAADLGLEIDVLVVEPASGSETALRQARYEALLDGLRPGEILVTGHTSDDQAETVLLNLLRGSGPRGLAGIPPTRGPIRRPFLDVPASKLRAVAIDLGLPFVDDPENVSTRHLRNRVRHELLPLLERSYQPSIRTTLTRTARNMADLANVLEAVAARVPMERSPAGVRAPLGRLAAVDAVVRRQVFRIMLSAVRPPNAPTEDEVLRLESTFAGAGPSEFAGTAARCFVEGPWLVLGSRMFVDASTARLIDGLEWAGYRFGLAPGRGNGIRLSRWRFVSETSDLWVRPVQPSDTIAMRGGSKHAGEAIREWGFRPESHPCVVDVEDRIVWIPGVRHAWRPLPGDAAPDTGYLVSVVDQDSSWAPFEP
jgi:tRNA(Ile)-lysidine synthetase-like protein